MRLPLQWKILLGYLVVAGIGMGAAGWLALDALERSDLEQLRVRLAAQARMATRLFAGPLAAARPDSSAIDALADQLGDDIKARVTVVNPEGVVLGDSYESGEGLRRMDNHLSRPEVREALATGMGVSARLSDTVGIRMLNLALPVRAPQAGNRVMGVVRLSLPLTEIEQRHRDLRRMLAAALGGAFLLSLVLSYAVARGITRPLADIVAAARRMARGEFHERVRVTSTTEVAYLAEILNQMAVSLEENIRNLHRLEQVRKDFVANVSHELRTPLTAIKGYVEAIQDGGKDKPEELDRFLDIIKAHTERLNLIITDLLLLSKIESGQVPLKQEPVALAGLIDRTVGLLRHLIEQKKHRVVVNIPADLPPILGDEERLGQVFSNLLDNAIKYTPENGTITISAALSKTAPPTMIEADVADTGIGIPSKDLPRIFERFYRVDKARSRELGGTGLGLAIVKHLVEGHGGTVSVASLPGQGTRFTVRLPLSPSSIPAA
ncbi:MAG: HAMP domain-containing histidine kinase [Nitrospirae bacterium]|nr:MAG: HAMP domain-containing histidine kinase [Nitrospirota bacterium]